MYDTEVIDRSRKGKGRKTQYTVEQIKEVTVGNANKRRLSMRKTSRQFNSKNNVKMSKSTIWKLRKEAGLKLYHWINAPMMTNMNRYHRVALAKCFSEQFEIGLLHPLHLIFTDEFMIWFMRKTNTKNDIIWTFDITDIPCELRYNWCPRNPDCLGVFVMLSDFGVYMDVKDEGQSWDGEHFRDLILGMIAWILVYIHFLNMHFDPYDME